MNSISHYLGLVRCKAIELREFGIKATFEKKGRGKHLDGVKRGKIRGWSANSARRLRDTLNEKWVPDSQVVGLTLTLPWKNEFDGLADEFRKSVHRFSIAFRRAYPNSAAVYRIELQTRGMPHLHAICFFGSGDRFLSDELLVMWWKQGFRDLRDGSMMGYLRRGVKCDSLNLNAKRLVMYLCDHTSKRKQAQLGWVGRQWGVIASSNLSNRPFGNLPPFSSERSEGYFWRLVHFFTRYRVKGKGNCPFGYHYTRPKRRFGVTFGISPAVAWRFYRAAEDH